MHSFTLPTIIISLTSRSSQPSIAKLLIQTGELAVESHMAKRQADVNAAPKAIVL